MVESPPQPLSAKARPVHHANRIELPRRTANYRFALTPLADAMFQLLIFFMLSSSLTPYSLLPLQSGGQVADGAPGQPGLHPQPPSHSVQPGDTALWTLEAEAVIVGGQRFGFDALDDLTQALGQDGAVPKVVVIVRPSARVQDVSTVLARLRAADVSAVQLATGGS
ncbi:hypothetical protein BFP70_15625 [Thioclava sp. SK-1]|uniref:ExbD/TolR family protein n=1 Tax=Thioclava sp. SK-1 TaxID=1889770 RepID=UPI000824DF4F|nr:biopolymer transporter ExbD [Thioclava sp. SK-1]OCX61447.1 hypothetical protein BFP70_15625 [Thioclava sp. SK-1]